MARVAIASCYDKHNYGSVLQAYATQHVVEKLGHEVVTLDKSGVAGDIAKGRRRYYVENLFNFELYRAKVGFLRHRLRQKTSRGFRLKMKQRHSAFKEFTAEHFTLSPRTRSFDELQDYCKAMDAVVVGSDQLWLPVNIAGDYFTLSFVPCHVRKIAYATSFGVSSLSEVYLGKAATFLSSFDAISVREDSGADLIERAMGERCDVVCDPTMLLSAGEWSELADDGYAVPDEPYVLCYFLGKNAWNRECARKLAEKVGCKVLAISHLDEYVSYDDKGYADLQPYDVGPAQWLSLLRGARYVCTDSFHGTVFSCLLGKEFFSFRRHEGMGAQSTNSRLDTLLARLGLQGRLCESERQFRSVMDERIDYTMVSCAIEDYRSKSIGWLARSLGSAEFACKQRHVSIVRKDECCGCSACMNVCPQDCIRMEFDVEGCEYPLVNEARCVSCGKCVKVCPIIHRLPERPFGQSAYLLQHRNERVLRESTSGGAFSAIAQPVLDRGGVVYGHGWDGTCREDGRPKVSCFGVDRADGLAKFRNSKYVQSEVGYVFREIKKRLDSGSEVLFSGTPCQCEGLLSYLRNKPPALSMADVVCRAVPCRAAFSSYCDWLEAGFGAKPLYVRFRDKRRFGYRYSSICAFREGDEQPFYSAGVESDPMLRAFFSNICDRPSCYECRFKKRYRQVDLTLWDCFEPGRFCSDLDNNCGVTRVLVHSEKGRQMVEDARQHARVVEVSPDALVAGVREMFLSVADNSNRERFMADVAELGGYEVMEKWFPDALWVKAERVARGVAERFGVYDQAKRTIKKITGKL